MVLVRLVCFCLVAILTLHRGVVAPDANDGDESDRQIDSSGRVWVRWQPEIPNNPGRPRARTPRWRTWMLDTPASVRRRFMASAPPSFDQPIRPDGDAAESVGGGPDVDLALGRPVGHTPDRLVVGTPLPQQAPLQARPVSLIVGDGTVYQMPARVTFPGELEGHEIAIPHANTRVTRFDYSLPTRYRMLGPFTDRDPALGGPSSYDDRRAMLSEMLHYHTVELANTRVARVFEPNFPSLAVFPGVQASAETYAASMQAMQSQLRMPYNGFLFYGKQVMMLNNVQYRIRGLHVANAPLIVYHALPSGHRTDGIVMRPPATELEDPIEVKVFRSRLYSALMQEASRPSSSGTPRFFPKVLQETLFELMREQRRSPLYAAQSAHIDNAWRLAFPFLFDGRIDITHFLLNY